MTTAFDWSSLDALGIDFSAWPPDVRSFFSPRDACVPHVLQMIVSSAQDSVKVNMYGYDDDALDAILHSKAALPGFCFQMSLDKSQAGGVHEKALVAPWASSLGTSVAVGTSVKSAISHLKVCIIDGLYVVSGSTNWSTSGETKQDNELVIHRNAALASRYGAVLDMNHAAMLTQMQKK
jgi:phosphatidylserine/phosphatidylglycerophosphate/cardiolipin synthase-like enzyme